MFSTHPLAVVPLGFIASNSFDLFSSSQSFESISKHRQARISVLPSEDRTTWPIYRTTLRSSNAPSEFSAEMIHLSLEIEKHLVNFEGKPRCIRFNHAVTEIWYPPFGTTAFHSHQRLDLDEDRESVIAMFSSYQSGFNVLPNQMRYLTFRRKGQGNLAFAEEVTIPLLHNTCVIMSAEINAQYEHKITTIRDGSEPFPDRWMCITFRTSKTFVRMDEGDSTPRIVVDAESNSTIPLRLAEEKDLVPFFRMKGEENVVSKFVWKSFLDYTLNQSDLLRYTE